MADLTIRELTPQSAALLNMAVEVETGDNNSGFINFSQLAPIIPDIKEVYADIAARDAGTSAIITNNVLVEVTDAGADPIITTGRAWYRRNIAGSPDWILVSKEEDLQGSGLISLEAYRFDAVTTDSSPASGNLRINNTDVSLGNELYIHDENINGLDISDIISELSVGTKIAFQQLSDATNAAVFEVAGAIVDNGSYSTIPVTFLTKGSGIGTGETFDDTEILGVSLFENNTAISGSDEPETIVFNPGLETQFQRPYIMPLQITDIVSPGISTVQYFARPDDGVSLFTDTGNVNAGTITELNTYLDSQTDLTWHVVRVVVTLSRQAVIRRLLNIS